jgi:hypothetical protein
MSGYAFSAPKVEAKGSGADLDKEIDTSDAKVKEEWKNMTDGKSTARWIVYELTDTGKLTCLFVSLCFAGFVLCPPPFVALPCGCMLCVKSDHHVYVVMDGYIGTSFTMALVETGTKGWKELRTKLRGSPWAGKVLFGVFLVVSLILSLLLCHLPHANKIVIC